MITNKMFVKKKKMAGEKSARETVAKHKTIKQYYKMQLHKKQLILHQNKAKQHWGFGWGSERRFQPPTVHF